jgi:transposase-like protein
MRLAPWCPFCNSVRVIVFERTANLTEYNCEFCQRRWADQRPSTAADEPPKQLPDRKRK